MALNQEHLAAFARMDTRKQLSALRRCGVETGAADVVLGYLAGNHPDRYSALKVALERDDMGIA